MTRQFPTIRRVAVLLLALALPIFAAGQTKRRAVAPHGPLLATLTGTITDSATGQPVVQATVAVAGRNVAQSDTKGLFTAKLTPGVNVPLSIQRSGYETLTTSANISGDATRSFKLVSKPVTTVRTVAGTTIQVDTETIEFGYLAPFSGYVKDTKLNLCAGGGGSFTPERADIKKITGGAQVNDAACCSRGAIPAINVTLKSGTTTTGGFVDACVGYTVDLIGRDHLTAQPVYVHFPDIAQIDFP